MVIVIDKKTVLIDNQLAKLILVGKKHNGEELTLTFRFLDALPAQFMDELYRVLKND